MINGKSALKKNSVCLKAFEIPAPESRVIEGLKPLSPRKIITSAWCSYLLGKAGVGRVIESLPLLSFFCLSPRMICPCQSEGPPAKEIHLLIMILNYQKVQFTTHLQQVEIVERRY